jgi:molecular chaperone DnaK (HSP70)
MVEESVARAFDDLKARQWIEAKLRADETLAATRKALVDCAAEMDADYKAKVEAAVKAVADLAALEQGDPAALKSSLAALDEATKPLADLLMDKTLEEMLRRRGLVK